MITDAPKPKALKGQSKTKQAQNARKAKRERFAQSRRAEVTYSRQLKRIAVQVGHIVDALAPAGVVRSSAQIANALQRYAQLIQPWAVAVSENMIAEVSKRDEIAWANAGKEMGRLLSKEIKRAPTGLAMQKMLTEQVVLITSLPLEAAKRVHKLTVESISQTGARATEIAAEIQKTGHVTKSRAMLIARTEVARTATSLTAARAAYVGSEGYIWRTVGDSDVRPLHKELEGVYVKWGEPPIAGEKGERAHAGAIYNCRCYPEPVIPDVIQ